MHCVRITNTLSTIVDLLGTSCNGPFGMRARVILTAWFLVRKKLCPRNRLQAERLDTLTVISDEGLPLEKFPFNQALMK